MREIARARTELRGEHKQRDVQVDEGTMPIMWVAARGVDEILRDGVAKDGDV